MEQIKLKVRDIAKDLNTTPTEVIDILKNYTGNVKKIGTALNQEEANILLEKTTQGNQVKDFNAFFAMRNKPKEDVVKSPVSEQVVVLETSPSKKEEKSIQNIEKSQEKPTEKLVVKPVEEILAEKSKPELIKPVNSQTIQSEKPKRINPQPEKPQLAKPQPQNIKPSTDKIQPAKPQGEKTFAQRDRNFNLNQNRNNQPPRPVIEVKKDKPIKPKITPKPIQAAVDINTLKTNEPPKSKIKGEAVQRGEQVTKRVDTRGTYVELDKYNERYEKIAPVVDPNNKRLGNDFGRKQKINQKSHQNKRPQFGGNKNYETEAQKLKRLELERARKQQLRVYIPDEIVVSELAARLKVNANEVIKKLFNVGIMANINQSVDFDTASLVAEELGAKVEKEIVVTIEERLFEEIKDTDDNLQPRPPVVVVMGHVDHGKTSLLDRIRNASVASDEAGGITQHIGAYKVNAGGKDITFLDTPGHEAFTSMRARGASITDIAILVVSADDGIMPQTIEAINHAKAAQVTTIIAINKIDKETANPERIKQELTEHGLLIEEWGGDIICVPVSAKTGEGIDNLLEMINLSTEFMELKANPYRLAVGTVIEAQLDKGRGPIATVLVQKGTLHTGDVIIAGTSVGHVRVMRDDRGRVIKEAGPSVPVEVMGLAEVPSAGDTFAVVEDEKLARELVDKRKHEAKQERFDLYQKVTLDNLFSHIEDGTVKSLPVIVKADVQGSVEAVRQSLEKLSNQEVRVKVIHGGVGAISESDVMLANASNAIIIGFNVRPHPAAAEGAKRDGVDIRLYRIIYDAIEEIQTAMKGMLAPKFREVESARIEVRNVFKITGVGTVAGCYVLNGKVARSCEIRVVRDGIIINVDKIDSLKRFKDDVKEVAQGYECGISLQHFSDIKEGDIFEAFIIEEYRD